MSLSPHDLTNNRPLQFATEMRVQTVYSNEQSPYAPLIILVSHLDNVLESQSIEHFVRSLHTMLGKQTPSMTVVSAQNSMASLHGEMLEYVRSTAKSGIVTLNAWLAESLAHDFRVHGSVVPHFFAGMNDVANFESLDVAHVARDYLTGVVTKHPHYNDVLALTQEMYGRFSRALFITNPDHHHAHSAQLHHGVTRENLALCKRAGIEPVAINARCDFDIHSKLTNRLRPGHDVIFTGVDNVALSSGETIGAIANEYEVPVVTQSLEMVSKGHAVFGIGSGCEQTMLLLAKRAYHVLADGMMPSDMPLTVIKEKSNVAFNPHLLQRQGLKPSAMMMHALNAYSIYDRF